MTSVLDQFARFHIRAHVDVGHLRRSSLVELCISSSGTGGSRNPNPINESIDNSLNLARYLTMNTRL